MDRWWYWRLRKISHISCVFWSNAKVDNSTSRRRKFLFPRGPKLSHECLKREMNGLHRAQQNATIPSRITHASPNTFTSIAIAMVRHGGSSRLLFRVWSACVYDCSFSVAFSCLSRSLAVSTVRSFSYAKNACSEKFLSKSFRWLVWNNLTILLHGTLIS